MPDPALALGAALIIIALVVVTFWPRTGLWARLQQLRRRSIHFLRENALKSILKAEINGHPATIGEVAGDLDIRRDRAAALIAEMQELGWLAMEGEGFVLTPTGRQYAIHILRAHRLWERYLADETGYGAEEWHVLAEHHEHRLSPEDAAALATRLGYPSHDPHGDPIPTPEGKVVGHGGVPLTDLSRHQAGRIVHLEDEPEAIGAQLVAEGLVPGMVLRVTETGPDRVRFWANGEEHVLAPIVAAHIAVRPVERPALGPESKPGVCLNDLAPGETGRVIRIEPGCRGVDRRRLMDMGLLPGTEIEVELVSPGGDPSAYRLRGALLALREEQARHIRVERA